MCDFAPMSRRKCSVQSSPNAVCDIGYKYIENTANGLENSSEQILPPPYLNSFPALVYYWSPENSVHDTAIEQV